MAPPYTDGPIGREEIFVTYRIETPTDPEQMAAKIASDQSTGTFVPLPGETPDLKARAAARIHSFKRLEAEVRPAWPAQGSIQSAEATIAFPLEAVGTDLAALTTVALGGIWSIRGLSGLRVIGVKLPPAFAGVYPGPQFGITGTRALTGVQSRPVIGTIVKPALGLLPDDTAQLVGELVASGVDFIKDDEKLASPPYSSLEARVKAILPVILDHEQKTGKKVMYAFGISDIDPDEMMRKHDLVLSHGGNAAVININSIGPGAFLFLRRRSQIVLHAHRNGWDLLTRHPQLGYDFSVYQQIWRLLGVDQFQINGIGAKYWEPDDSFVRSFLDLQRPVFTEADRPMPVVCSGQWGGQAPETYRRTGQTQDLLYLCGGGVVSHPGGPAAGVRAVQAAWDAAVKGVPLEVAAIDNPDLKAALAKFGAKPA
jgi:ribulose-bisphosphate carboxylase large chain